MANATDIVGYSFRGATYCPEHIVDAMANTEEYDGWGLANGVRMPIEENLNEIAFAFGIERNKEETFDAEEFPKVIFRGELTGQEICVTDGEPLD